MGFAPLSVCILANYALQISGHHMKARASVHYQVLRRKNGQPLQKWVTHSLHSKSEFVKRRNVRQPRSKCMCATRQQRTEGPAQDRQRAVAQHMKINALHWTSISATAVVYKGTGRRIAIWFTKGLANASQYFGMLAPAGPQRGWFFPPSSRPEH